MINKNNNLTKIIIIIFIIENEKIITIKITWKCCTKTSK